MKAIHNTVAAGNSLLLCIPKILKNESNSQPVGALVYVVVYPKDTEK
jgi:hypothetical protein